jgi:hypothetical protein
VEKALFTETMSAMPIIRLEDAGTPICKEYMSFRMLPASIFMYAHDVSVQIKSKRYHNSFRSKDFQVNCILKSESTLQVTAPFLPISIDL